MATVISLFIVLFIGAILFKVFKKIVIGFVIMLVSLLILCTLCISIITKYSTIQERIDKYKAQYEKVLDGGTLEEIEEWNDNVKKLKEHAENIWTNIFIPDEVINSLEYIENSIRRE